MLDTLRKAKTVVSKARDWLYPSARVFFPRRIDLTFASGIHIYNEIQLLRRHFRAWSRQPRTDGREEKKEMVKGSWNRSDRNSPFIVSSNLWSSAEGGGGLGTNKSNKIKYHQEKLRDSFCFYTRYLPTGQPTGQRRVNLLTNNAKYRPNSLLTQRQGLSIVPTGLVSRL